MKTFNRNALSILALVLSACGGRALVEFGDGPDAGSAVGGTAGTGGRAGNAGTGGRAGNAGTSGRAGNSGTGGANATAGEGGDPGIGGSLGDAGNAGNAGDAGQSGDAGEGGASGTPGAGGTAGVSGAAGLGGEGGDSGLLEVRLTNPADDDLDVAINKLISADFNQALNPLTVPASFTLTGPDLAPVSGNVVVVGSVATFDPDDDLSPNTIFTATFTTAATALGGAALASEYSWEFTTGTEAAQTTPQSMVPLGAASSFAILASAAITNIELSLIVGDVGLTPDTGANISGFSQPATCPEVTGIMYAVDVNGPACATMNPTFLDAAKLSAQAAYLDATAVVRGTPQAIAGDLDGLTLYPGLYEASSLIELGPGGFLYLDAQGDSSAVFIIRSANSITTFGTSEVMLTKGAQAANVFWSARTEVILGTNSIMKGTIIGGTAISFLTGASLDGRALNQGPAAAAITLDMATIRVPSP